MNKCVRHILTAVLVVLACCMALAPFVTAAACDHPGRPDADFTMDHPPAGSGITDDQPPITVYFTDRSQSRSDEPVSSWKWEFGDGTTSTAQNPRHTYVSTGPYTVRLTISTVCGNAYADTISRHLDVYCNYPVPGFTTDVSEGMAPLTVHVTDTSAQAPDGVSIWTYWFDGTHSSHRKNPEYTYTRSGTYTINQTISKNCLPPDTGLPVAKRTITVYPTLGIMYTINPDYTVATTTAAATTTATPAPATTSAAPVITTTAVVSTPVPVATALPVLVPAIPPAPGTGTLSVTTEPAGASVWVDDVKWGASPAMIPNLVAGAHMLRLEKAGYQDLSVPVTVTDGKTAEYALALEPASGGSPVTLPFIAGAVVILVLAAGGGYLYTKRKKAP